MAYNINPFKDRIKSIEEWLKKEYGAIRTGQATPAILDNVTIESYGSRLPLSQIGSISIEDPRTLKVSPWDAGQIKDVEKAILTSDLGLSARVDETGVRVIFPALTEERRMDFVKVAKAKLEEAKISLRKEREKMLKDIDQQEDGASITEDEAKRAKTELQKLVDAGNASFEVLKDKKEKDILN